MLTLKGTKTEQNLFKAFARESQYHDLYTRFAGIARNEELEQIAYIFAATANQIKDHAKLLFQFLDGGMSNNAEDFQTGTISDTLDNLLPPIESGYEERIDLYLWFAEIAKNQGFNNIAIAFRHIAQVKKEYGERYSNLCTNLKLGNVLEKNGVVIWKCRNCGSLHEGKSAPNKWPTCINNQWYFGMTDLKY